MIYKYIAIEGNIGAGKTTLCHKLAKDLGASIILERFADNVFLNRFYEHPEKYAFQLETSFLMDRYAQIRDNVGQENGPFISDYYIGKCIIFAQINLSKDQFGLFREIYNNFAQQLPRPDLILYLHNSVTNLRKNISYRGRPYENYIRDEYLQQISEGYDRYFETVRDIPVLKIDLTHSDFVKQDSAYMKMWKFALQPWQPGLTKIEV